MDAKEIIRATQVAIKLLEETGTLERIKGWFTRPEQHTVIVLGASGTGKDSLILRLRGLTSRVSRQLRTTVAESKRGKLGGSLKIKFVNTPGQLNEPFSGNRFKAIQRAMAERRLGIVNVTSHGYHEGIVETTTATTSSGTIRKNYQKNRLAEEKALLAQWVNTLCGPGGAARWLITVCSKADLWWTPERRDEVLGHYTSGDYFQHLGEAARIDHAVLRFSSHNQMFYDTVPMSGYYTDQMREQDHAALAAAILENFAKDYV